MNRKFLHHVIGFIAAFALFSVFVPTQSAAALANWPVVRKGEKGANVATIQYLLRHRGYTLTVDRDFGTGTENVVKSFQRANSLTDDGIVGKNTWEKLVVTVDYGANNNAVRALQEQLNKHGYNLTVDGDFGNNTRNAVLDFKNKHFLGSGSTVGITTWQELTGSGASGGGYSLPIGRSVLARGEYDDPHHDYPAIDLPTWTGVTAYAMRGGTVSYVGGGCGLGILITANDGASYKYCHLNSRSVSAGSTVSTGQVIGTTGNTGNSTGPHLHLEVRYNGGALRCPQRMLIAIYDGAAVPHPSTLPTSGCTY